MEAINFAKQQQQIIAVVVDKVDRLQRSYNETPLLNHLIKNEKIELHFNTENCVIHKYSTSHELMLWDIHVLMAKNYVNSLKDNVNRGIARKLRVGEWIATAPIGYLHFKENIFARGRSDIIVDEPRAVLIKKMFKLFSTGNYSMPQILKKTKEWGLTNSRGNQGYLYESHIHSIIKNPFYYGVMRIKKTGKEYPHKYPAIIDKNLFDICQKVRLNLGKKWQVKYRGKEFIFRGLIKCSYSGRVVTCDVKKKTYTNGTVGQWTYLRMWKAENHKKAIYIPEKIPLQKVENVFKSMKLTPELRQEVIMYIKSSANAEKEYHKKRLTELYTENTKIETRIGRLMDYFLDGELNKEEHEVKRLELKQKRENNIREIEAHNKTDDSFTKMLISLVELASDAYQTFIGSTVEEKRNLINLVFANLKLKLEKLEFKLRSPFDISVEIPKTSKWRTLKDSNL